MFEGKAAIVTGASRGIGRAIAVDLARHGADLAIVARNSAALEKTAEAARALRASVAVEPIVADVTDAKAVDGAVAAALARFGRIDFAIANAGRAFDGLIVRTKPEDLEAVLAVNQA